MITYISIIRGINVSGQKLIKMAILKKMFEGLNLENIQTYVQSGNVVFSSKKEDTKELEKIISSGIEAEFGFDVSVIVLNSKSLETIIEGNPFAKDPLKDNAFLHVTFLADTPLCVDEEIEFTSNAVYLYCPNGYGKTKLNNNFLESRLKVKATTRNWKTTNELLKLARTVN